jgi:hypothetical protein
MLPGNAMQIKELCDLFKNTRRRCHLVGDERAGVLVGLDLEGRLYAIAEGEALNRVNPEALEGQSTKDGFLNPGGDGLWPAPEGSRLGYEYATGQWRVPPGLTGARYRVTDTGPGMAVVQAEIDLINSNGLGMPMVFERRISVTKKSVPVGKAVRVLVCECMKYLGRRPLPRTEATIAPWTLAQFDSGPGAEVVFPGRPDMPIHDFYDPSTDRRRYDGKLWRTRTDGSGPRYQIGLEPEVPWIEYRYPARGLTVRRMAAPVAPGLEYMDIADRQPDCNQQPLFIRYSVYSDPSGFMEIEAAGGAPAVLTPEMSLELSVETTYFIEKPQ